MVGPSCCGRAGGGAAHSVADTSKAAASATTMAARAWLCGWVGFGIMGTRMFALFIRIFVGGAGNRALRLRRADRRCPVGRRTVCLAVQFLGRLCRDLGDIQRDILLLAAAFDGHGCVIRSLNRIEDR